MKNNIVIFSNIKGGVGKTTLCALFASFLAEKGVPVISIKLLKNILNIW